MVDVAAIEKRTQGYVDRIRDALTRPTKSELSLEGAEVYRGKVRDVYKLKDVVVMVATGRQSAFDRQLTTVPYKGAVLNQISAWWFDTLEVPHHGLAVPEPATLLAKKCTPFPIEFVVRAYITGSTNTSMWTHYKKGVRSYCGHDLPEGLVKNQKLSEPLLTPTTKDAVHDVPISATEIVSSGRMTQTDWDTCKDLALTIFHKGQAIAEQRGLILVDTKYEFGKDAEGQIVLIDEVHTPDSSRFWLSPSYQTRFDDGLEPENIDKEFLRLWYKDNAPDVYDTSVPLPKAPDDLVIELARRYILLFELITGRTFDFERVGRGGGSSSDDDNKITTALQDPNLHLLLQGGGRRNRLLPDIV